MRMIAPRTGAREITLAEDQLEYSTLTVAVYNDKGTPGVGPRVLVSRWTLTPEERAQVAAGEDVFVALQTGPTPMQPIIVDIGARRWTAPETEDT
ncbi:MAG TPA: hypothetical protein VKD22_10470 [Ramlibacter sp.]|nr:hypothetical protein [Ramlibacter sp.]